MDLQQQKDILNLYYKYQDTNRDIIKTNIKEYMDDQELRPAEAAKKTGIALQTIYQMRKFNNTYKPDFITAMILCDLLKIPITEVMQPIPGLKIPEPKTTKWSTEAKQKFINDYNSLPITQLCKKYDITQRTAAEYNRVFNMDVES